MDCAPSVPVLPIDDGSYRMVGDVLEEHLSSLCEQVGLFVRGCAQCGDSHDCPFLSVLCFSDLMVRYERVGSISDDYDNATATGSITALWYGVSVCTGAVAFFAGVRFRGVGAALTGGLTFAGVAFFAGVVFFAGRSTICTTGTGSTEMSD